MKDRLMDALGLIGPAGLLLCFACSPLAGAFGHAWFADAVRIGWAVFGIAAAAALADHGLRLAAKKRRRSHTP